MERFLVIEGDSDFNVVNWQKSGMGFDQTIKAVEKSDGLYIHVSKKYCFTVSIIDFDFTINKKDKEGFQEFFSFIKENIGDYDQLKSYDIFYIDKE